MDSPKRNLIILGAGSFAEEGLDVVQETGLFDVACFVEGIDRSKIGRAIAGIPVVWVDDVKEYDRSNLLLCLVGSPARRNFIAQIEKVGFEFATVVHPSARVSRSVTIGRGVFISVGCIVAARSSIGDHVILNRAAVIGHHVTVGDYTTVSPGANIGGGASIGSGCYIGMGAIILDHVSVGDNSVVGAGAVVTKDVPAEVQVVGVPARITKTFPNEIS